MRRRPTVHRLPPGHAPSNRVAWWMAFLITIALIALLNAVRADGAMLPGGPPVPAFADLEAEEPEGELAEEEEEEAGLSEECGPEETAECLEGIAGEGPPRECRLSDAVATVSAYPHGRRVVLTIHYTARLSTRVEISYRSHGPRGGLKMKGGRGRFAGTASFREAQTMTPAQMTRVLAAKSFSVEIRPLGAPASCEAYFDQQLTVRRATPHGPIWQSWD